MLNCGSEPVLSNELMGLILPAIMLNKAPEAIDANVFCPEFE
jgi:hypothetical protein